VSRLREGVVAHIDSGAPVEQLTQQLDLAAASATQLVEYLGAARAALGIVPTQKTIVFERFSTSRAACSSSSTRPSAAASTRVGLALRKRFCRKFNFELQAAATEDAIVLSLSTSHSFPLEDVARYLHSRSVRPLLIQAMLDAPMFAARWRWTATTSLALPRFRSGRKVARNCSAWRRRICSPSFPRSGRLRGERGGRARTSGASARRSDSARLSVRSDGCGGLEDLLRAMEIGEIRTVHRDLTEPSPFALEILTARPYAFLDDAPLEERRTQAVIGRRWLDEEAASGHGRLGRPPRRARSRRASSRPAESSFLIEPAPADHRLGATLFQRGIVEERVRPRGENLERER